ncbi:heparinase II/III family protein [Thalassotalea sp. LPB0316]|uniref:heparinase II/III domain-containing protein n=1 Tax=Thalassotalea sp. LPB0316 TaxID=2769490 RepID=UPI00186904DF|nr:heparinase II/III family protein [Thalassotalea sp. LPB0316]QOL24412.1 heparinase II/III family protein [Thalassotalea sp. LPB0316]
MTLFFSDTNSYLTDNYCYQLWGYAKQNNTETNTFQGGKYFDRSNFIGHYVTTSLEDSLCFQFSGELGSYQINFDLNKAYLVQGLLFNLRLDDWEEISYLALGFTDEHGFAHVKVENPSQGLQIPVDLNFESLAWKLYQTHNVANINDIRIYLRGKPGLKGASIKLYEIGYIESIKVLETAENTHLSDSTSTSLFEYLKYIFPNYHNQAKIFLASGKCPLINNVNIEWDEQHVKPIFEDENNTLRYSWFALHPALILLLDYHYHDNNNALQAAFDIFLHWYNESFIKPELDIKYNWYDHGVSERQIATILLKQALIRADQLPTNRLKKLDYVIRQQGELLASEVFYCRDQVDRYHNHGCFQDLALLISSALNIKGKKELFWSKVALTRLEDQITNIVYQVPNYAISLENSLGYQYVLYRILDMFAGILFDNKKFSEIPLIARGMKNFLRLYKYPNGELPAFGDTFKYHMDDIEPLPFNSGVYNFTEAGYVLLKELFYQKEFYFAFFATSLGKVHKHQDNLSFTLFFDGVEWFNDPSFYSHEYSDDVPKYLRSANAHNNVVVLDRDYDLSAGTASISNVHSGDAKFHVSASHSCYKHIEVKRDVDVCYNNASLLISDVVKRLKRSIKNQPYIVFQLGIGVEASHQNREIKLTHPSTNFTLVIEMNSENFQIVKGREKSSPFHGISGERFLQTKDTICIVHPIQFEKKIETKISIR